jgi:hypothetical protein
MDMLSHSIRKNKKRKLFERSLLPLPSARAFFTTIHGAAARFTPGNLLFPSLSLPKPPGPFASWPKGQKEDAIKGVRSRCSFLTGMVLDNYQGPKGAILHVIQAMMAACVSKEMPSDWPGQSDMHTQLDHEDQAARVIDPTFPSTNVLVKIFSHLNR